jgi:hypothetical protein
LKQASKQSNKASEELRSCEDQWLVETNKQTCPQSEHKRDGALLGWIRDSISITWNCLCWFAVLTLGVVGLNFGPTFVASNLHFWTVSLFETLTMAPEVNRNEMGCFLVGLWIVFLSLGTVCVGLTY